MLQKLGRLVRILVVTSDTFGTVEKELGGLPVEIIRLRTGQRHHEAKLVLLRQRCPALSKVAVFGNGRNDALVLAAVKKARGVAVAVDNGEGVAREATENANLLIHGADNALQLLLEPNRLKAYASSAIICLGCQGRCRLGISKEAYGFFI